MKSKKKAPSQKPDKTNGNGRRDFLLQASLAAVGISAAGVPSLRASTSNLANGSRVPLQKPISWRLLNSDTKQNGAVKEGTAVIELTGSNGARHISDCYSKRIEHQDGHEDIVLVQTDQFADGSDSKPAFSETRTILTSTRFGELKDNVRKDEVTVRMVDGKERRTFPPLTVKVPVPNPYSGLSDQELMDKILSEKLGPR